MTIDERKTTLSASFHPVYFHHTWIFNLRRYNNFLLNTTHCFLDQKDMSICVSFDDMMTKSFDIKVNEFH